MPNPTLLSERPVHTRDTHAGRALARDEAVVWQGSPSILGIAHRVLGGDLVLGYFVLLLLVDSVRAVLGQTTWLAAISPLLPAVITGAILFGLARAIARSTRYIVTTRRVIIRYGAALPRSLSLPFSQIQSLSLAPGARGRGDIALRTRGSLGVSYLKLWPHARGWHIKSPQPTLRDVPDAGVLATRLSRLLSQAEQARLAAATMPVKAALRASA